MLNTMCPNCARKRQSLYIQTPVEGSDRRGVCKFCFRRRRAGQSGEEVNE